MGLAQDPVEISPSNVLTSTTSKLDNMSATETTTKERDDRVRWACKAPSALADKVDKDLDGEGSEGNDIDVAENRDATCIAADLHILNTRKLRSPIVELARQNHTSNTEVAVQAARITADLKLLEKKNQFKPAKNRKAMNLVVECNSSFEFEPRKRIPVTANELQAARVAADLNLVKKLKSPAVGRHSKFMRSASEPRLT